MASEMIPIEDVRKVLLDHFKSTADLYDELARIVMEARRDDIDIPAELILMNLRQHTKNMRAFIEEHFPS